MKHLTDQAAVVSRSKLQEAQQLALENLKARDDRNKKQENTYPFWKGLKRALTKGY